MERIAFKMLLKPGKADEYRRRHDAIWPELVALLKEADISDYSIWLDAETNTLFATLIRSPGHRMDGLRRRRSCGAGGSTWGTSWQPTRTARP